MKVFPSRFRRDPTGIEQQSIPTAHTESDALTHNVEIKLTERTLEQIRAQAIKSTSRLAKTSGRTASNRER